MMQKVIIKLFLVLSILCPSWMAMAQSDCSLAPQLVIGEMAQVSEGQSNNVRENPSRDATRLGVIPSGGILEVLEGPTCADGLRWWRVHYENLIGWTVEGSDGEYWLLPMTEQIQASELPLALPTIVITAENASQLQPIRSLNCDNGPESSVLVALGSRVVAMNCGAYNIRETNLSLHEQLLRDHLGIIDLETSQHVMTLSGEGASVSPIRFLPDGHLLWLSQEDSNSPLTLHLSDITTGEEITRTEINYEGGSGGLFIHPVFYANGTRFALFYLDDEQYVLHRWDASKLTLLEEQVFEIPEAMVEGDDVSFAIAPDGEHFAISYRVREGEHSELAIYASTNPQAEAVISLPFVVFNQSAYFTFSPSGNFIVGVGCRAVEIACGNSAIFWWSAADGTQVAEWDVPLEIAGRLSFSPDSRLLIMGGRILYDVDTGEVVQILEQGYWYDAVFSADSTFILTHGDPETRIWTVAP
jgi:WD40 repeat protein